MGLNLNRTFRQLLCVFCTLLVAISVSPSLAQGETQSGQRPVTKVKRPTTRAKRPTTRVKRPRQRVKRPVTRVKRSTTRVKRPVAPQRRLALPAKPSALTPSTQLVKKEIQTAINRENQAAARKDLAGMLKFLAPDYAHIDVRGNVRNYQQSHQAIGRILTVAKRIKIDSKVLTCNLKGKQAFTKLRENADMVLINPNNQQPVRVTTRATLNATYVKTNKGWLRQRSRTLAQETFINGKRMEEKASQPKAKKKVVRKPTGRNP